MRRAAAFFGAIFLHLVVIMLLLRDRIVLPIPNIGQSVFVQILQTENRPPENAALPPLDLDKAPPIIPAPPQIDLPLGKPASVHPMVVIQARFAPDVALHVPASEYPANLPGISGVYHVQVSVQVLDNGETGNVTIERSDGDQIIDNFIATYSWIHWRFAPSLNDGVPVMSWITVQVEMTATEMTVRG